MNSEERRLARRQRLAQRRQAGVPWKGGSSTGPIENRGDREDSAGEPPKKRTRERASATRLARRPAYGPATRKGGRRVLTDAQETEVVRLSLEGETARVVAAKFGIGYRTVYDVLKRNGHPEDRRSTRGPTPERVTRAERYQVMLGLGLTKPDIIRLEDPTARPNSAAYDRLWKQVTRTLDVPTRFKGWRRPNGDDDGRAEASEQ